jgi:hypothetical protein
MQLMNMAGVVAGPNRATLVPRIAMPAAMAGASTGPVSLGSLPTCGQHRAAGELQMAPEYTFAGDTAAGANLSCYVRTTPEQVG